MKSTRRLVTLFLLFITTTILAQKVHYKDRYYTIVKSKIFHRGHDVFGRLSAGELDTIRLIAKELYNEKGKLKEKYRNTKKRDRYKLPKTFWEQKEAIATKVITNEANANKAIAEVKETGKKQVETEAQNVENKVINQPKESNTAKKEKDDEKKKVQTIEESASKKTESNKEENASKDVKTQLKDTDESTRNEKQERVTRERKEKAKKEKKEVNTSAKENDTRERERKEKQERLAKERKQEAKNEADKLAKENNEKKREKKEKQERLKEEKQLKTQKEQKETNDKVKEQEKREKETKEKRKKEKKQQEIEKEIKKKEKALKQKEKVIDNREKAQLKKQKASKTKEAALITASALNSSISNEDAFGTIYIKINKEKTYANKSGAILLFFDMINNSNKDLVILKPNNSMDSRLDFFSNTMECEDIPISPTDYIAKDIKIKNEDYITIPSNSKIELFINGKNRSWLACNSDDMILQIQYNPFKSAEKGIELVPNIKKELNKSLKNITPIKIESENIKFKINKQE